jgi:cellobiose phosphorylase
VTDASEEAFFLRDEENGNFWSPSPLPVRGSGPYVTRHGSAIINDADDLYRFKSLAAVQVS